MNPFRFIPVILICMIAGEVFQVSEGLVPYEKLFVILSAVSHLLAFYFAWITVSEIKKDLNESRLQSASDATEFGEG